MLVSTLNMRSVAWLSTLLLAALACLASECFAQTIYARFGDIEGSATASDYQGWMILEDFELSIGGFPTDDRNIIQTFDARYSLKLDKAYPEVLLAASNGLQFSEIEVVFTTLVEGSMIVPFLEYGLSNASLGPVTLQSDGVKTSITGKIIDPEVLITTFTEYPFGDANNPQKHQSEIVFDRGPGALSLSTLKGDYDLNGNVDQADYRLWAQLFGSTNLVADGNADARVNLVDYTVWRNNLGSGVGELAQPSSKATVPEPRTNAVAAVVAIAVILRWRRHGRPSCYHFLLH